MPDIRKMLEEQLVKLQDASMNMEATADCTYAMLAIVDVLYPDGIPGAEKVGKVITSIKIDGKEIATSVIKELERRPEPIRIKLPEEIVEDLKIDKEPFVSRNELDSVLKRIKDLEIKLSKQGLLL